MIGQVEVTLRRATEADAKAVADMYIRARRAAADYIPSTVHSDDEVRAWIDGVDQLYLEPNMTGKGIGTGLLEHAKRERPDGLRLKTFVSNTGAQRFYERHGFTEAGRTDGDNEEGEPDILYVWP